MVYFVWPITAIKSKVKQLQNAVQPVLIAQQRRKPLFLRISCGEGINFSSTSVLKNIFDSVCTCLPTYYLYYAICAQLQFHTNVAGTNDTNGTNKLNIYPISSLLELTTLVCRVFGLSAGLLLFQLLCFSLFSRNIHIILILFNLYLTPQNIEFFHLLILSRLNVYKSPEQNLFRYIFTSS